jgi:hypothetical protein
MTYVKSYLNDLLIVTNNDFQDHQTKLEMVLARLSTAVMKIDAEKSKKRNPTSTQSSGSQSFQQIEKNYAKSLE